MKIICHDLLSFTISSRVFTAARMKINDETVDGAQWV